MWIGVERFVFVPSPSWPSVFRPQAQAEPSLSAARLCRRPLPMSTTF
jgi:hypothetical protein